MTARIFLMLIWDIVRCCTSAEYRRRMLLKSYGLDPDETGPAPETDSVRDEFIEVRTTDGWKVWPRSPRKEHAADE